jgi:hypothetical protein
MWPLAASSQGSAAVGSTKPASCQQCAVRTVVLPAAGCRLPAAGCGCRLPAPAAGAAGLRAGVRPSVPVPGVGVGAAGLAVGTVLRI